MFEKYHGFFQVFSPRTNGTKEYKRYGHIVALKLWCFEHGGGLMTLVFPHQVKLPNPIPTFCPQLKVSPRFFVSPGRCIFFVQKMAPAEALVHLLQNRQSTSSWIKSPGA